MNQIDVNELKKCLKNGVVSFTYSKKDGTTRQAVGTLCETIIIKNGGEMPKGTGESPNQTLPYWDIEKCAWRSCLIDNLIELNK